MYESEKTPITGDLKYADDVHDAKPLYDGVITVVKDIHYELVAKPDSIALYIAGHGKPVKA